MKLYLCAYIFLLTISKTIVANTVRVPASQRNWAEGTQHISQDSRVGEKRKKLLEDLTLVDGKSGFAAATKETWRSVDLDGEKRVKRMSAIMLPISMAMGLMGAIFGIYIDDSSKIRRGHHQKPDESVYDD